MCLRVTSHSQDVDILGTVPTRQDRRDTRLVRRSFHREYQIPLIKVESLPSDSNRQRRRVGVAVDDVSLRLIRVHRLWLNLGNIIIRHLIWEIKQRRPRIKNNQRRARILLLRPREIKRLGLDRVVCGEGDVLSIDGGVEEDVGDGDGGGGEGDVGGDAAEGELAEGGGGAVGVLFDGAGGAVERQGEV